MVRKISVGSTSFHDGRLHFFLGFSECDSCGQKYQVLVNMNDIRSFDRARGTQIWSKPLGYRLTRKLAAKYGLELRD